MKDKGSNRKSAVWGAGLAAWAVLMLAGCGGGGGGPAIEARPQTISFGAVPALNLHGTATVSATASSGLLPVTYRSTTPSVCTVVGNTDVVVNLTIGTCTIEATQEGNSTFAPARATQNIIVAFNPNQTVSFGAAPTLTLYSAATVSATATSGLPVTYSSTTPSVCTVNSSTGFVTDITMGACVITADQTGDTNYNAAQATLIITVSTSSGATVPGAPAGVAATLGNAPNTVVVSFASVESGGRVITGYTVTSSPGGITATGTTSPIAVTCPVSCKGEKFLVRATNDIGTGPGSAYADIITAYNVTTTFYEPDTQPNDTIFTGSFTLNFTTGEASGLKGSLTESMTGTGSGSAPIYDMSQLYLSNQLSSIYDGALGGLLVTAFLNNDTKTLSTAWGGDGWDPASLSRDYYGSEIPGSVNPYNAYVRVFVNTTDPLTPLTPTQLNKLAYADCAPGGMMGLTCMTGTTVAGYGQLGTMGGYPVSQTITKQ